MKIASYMVRVHNVKIGLVSHRVSCCAVDCSLSGAARCGFLLFSGGQFGWVPSFLAFEARWLQGVWYCWNVAWATSGARARIGARARAGTWSTVWARFWVWVDSWLVLLCGLSRGLCLCLNVFSCCFLVGFQKSVWLVFLSLGLNLFGFFLFDGVIRLVAHLNLLHVCVFGSCKRYVWSRLNFLFHLNLIIFIRVGINGGIAFTLEVLMNHTYLFIWGASRHIDINGVRIMSKFDHLCGHSLHIVSHRLMWCDWCHSSGCNWASNDGLVLDFVQKFDDYTDRNLSLDPLFVWHSAHLGDCGDKILLQNRNIGVELAVRLIHGHFNPVHQLFHTHTDPFFLEFKIKLNFSICRADM